MIDGRNAPGAPESRRSGAGSRSSDAPWAVPKFKVGLRLPNIEPWLHGNGGVPGFMTFGASRPGPHVGIIALIHGNEISGAIAIDQLLRAGLRPSCGRLTFGFANLDAFSRFDASQPTASRFVDEDLNRVWEVATLDGPRQSNELDRARRMRPIIDTLDVLLDLHSMLWPADPLILSGGTQRGRDLAIAIGMPSLVVADKGHVAGRRLIDYGGFADPAAAQRAVLVEAGQHWEPDSVAMALASIAGLLRHLHMVGDHPALPPSPEPIRSRFAEVTLAITAATSAFEFTQAFRGGDVIRRRDSLIGVDGTVEVRTPHDDCLLVMPSLRPSRGHTAVRLARFVDL